MSSAKHFQEKCHAWAIDDLDGRLVSASGDDDDLIYLADAPAAAAVETWRDAITTPAEAETALSEAINTLAEISVGHLANLREIE